MKIILVGGTLVVHKVPIYKTHSQRCSISRCNAHFTMSSLSRAIKLASQTPYNNSKCLLDHLILILDNLAIKIACLALQVYLSNISDFGAEKYQKMNYNILDEDKSIQQLLNNCRCICVLIQIIYSKIQLTLINRTMHYWRSHIHSFKMFQRSTSSKFNHLVITTTAHSR